MRVHWFQHVEFEGLGRIEPWLLERGHVLSRTRWWAGERGGAAAESCDWLVIMGGPMNVYQHRDHPWLEEEQAVIKRALARGARVLGVCLGAQLIADVLGGKVRQNPVREIGWWPVRAAAPEGNPQDRFVFPDQCMVLHWHGDTYTLPAGARRLAWSEGCAQQAFAWGDRVLALQFHLELGSRNLEQLIACSGDELAEGGVWVQSAEALRAGAERHAGAAAALLDRVLSALETAP